MPTLLSLGLTVLFATPPASWPQFRGPDGQGRADARRVPQTWSESENIVWKRPIPGRGWSSPVIRGAGIWLTTATTDESSPRIVLHALEVNLNDGRVTRDIELFAVAGPPKINAKNSHASPTGVLEPGRFYAHFGSLGSAAIDTETGAVVWTNRDLVVDHKEGPGSSPIIWEDLFIVHCDGIDAQYVAALDKATGTLVWKTPRPTELPENTDFRKAYSTPLVIEVAGTAQLISPGADWVIAYEPRTGKEIWRVHYSGFSNVPRPVFDGERVAICTGFMKPQLWAIDPKGRGDVTASHVRWQHTAQVPANPSPILVGDDLYMVSDQGIVHCLNAKTGRVNWKERIGGNFSASPILAAGRLYFFDEEGVTTVLEPGAKPRILARNELDGSIMATPAVIDPAFILRTDQALYRIESVTGSKTAAATR